MGGIFGAIIGFMLTTILDFSSVFPEDFNKFWVFALTLLGAMIGLGIELVLKHSGNK